MEVIKLPFLPLRGLILFPFQEYYVDLKNPASLASVRQALEVDKRLVIGFYKGSGARSKLALADVWEVGCETMIKSLSDLEGSAKRIFLEGVRRVRINIIDTGKDLMSCVFEPIGEPAFETSDHLGELAMHLQSLALSLESTTAFPPMAKPRDSSGLSRFVDMIAFRIALSSEERIRLLRAADARKRIEMLHMVLVQLVERENERLAEQAARDVAEREGSTTAGVTSAKPPVSADVKDTDVVRLSRLVHEAGMTDEAKAVATGELQRLQTMSTGSTEYSIMVSYLDTLAALPWSKASEDRVDIDEARRALDEDHFGLEDPKQRILEHLAVRKLTTKSGGGILCFLGPPGVGKTSLGQSIAKAMGREFIRTSLGGMRDEAEIRGHRRTYVGALLGRILQEIRRVGVKNPVFMLDEIDKLNNDRVHGDPAAAMLEVLDSEQNHSFKDNYLGVGFDLSQVFFIGTANDMYGLPPALRDRLEIVELPGYSALAKTHIARRHLIPKQKEKNGLSAYDIGILDDALAHMIEAYTSEAGVRNLERCCETVFRKLAVYAASGQELPGPVDAEMVRKLLGPPKLFRQKMADEPAIGISTGLAWSSTGGSILFIESLAMPGEGKIELTGNLGQVIQESAKAAHTWIRANAETLEIDPEVANKTSIHVHLPTGATPKDGPSAGVAMVVSVVSLLSKVPVRNDIAMTGEISLRGRILPVGGIVEKLLAAHRVGIREVIIPKDNKDSLSDVPEEVASEMRIHLVDQLEEALGIALYHGGKG